MVAADGQPHLLVVDDDRRLRELLRDFLGRNGYRVNVASDAAEARRQIAGFAFDLMILDVMMPGESGLELARSMRGSGNLPILLLTARGDAADRIAGLEAGADDYLPKPFEPRELLARLRAILRRRNVSKHVNLLRFGALEIDRDARVVRVAGVEKDLTSHQFALLVALAENAGRVLSRDALMDLMRGAPLEAFDRSIDVHVSRIRSAIEDDPKKPRRILTVRGAGYVFAKQQS